MALLNLFGKKLKGENQYFKNRISNSASKQPEQEKSPQPEALPVKNLVSDRLINKDLLAELLKTMRSHDVNASIMVMANTIDNTIRRPGIMINKGYIPKRIVSYLQNINLANIDEAIKLVQSRDTDANGFYPLDERAAALLNLPMGCMLLAIFNRIKKEFGVILVLKTNLKDPKTFLKEINKLIQR